jgi:hypothetical protein
MEASAMSHTPEPWRTEAVSDAVRIVVGTGRRKIILARLNPPRLPEAETHANAKLMAAAPKLLKALKEIAETRPLTIAMSPGLWLEQCVSIARAAIAEAQLNPVTSTPEAGGIKDSGEPDANDNL